jgi:hypothetical protein
MLSALRGLQLQYLGYKIEYLRTNGVGLANHKSKIEMDSIY